jgi:transposase-like protein
MMELIQGTEVQNYPTQDMVFVNQYNSSRHKQNESGELIKGGMGYGEEWNVRHPKGKLGRNAYFYLYNLSSI